MEANTVGATKPYGLPHGTVSPCLAWPTCLAWHTRAVLVFTKLQIAEPGVPPSTGLVDLVAETSVVQKPTTIS